MRRSLLAAALVAATLGVAACSSAPEQSSMAAPERDLTPTPELPEKLAANVRAADTIVGEGERDFRARMGELRGVPVVVNQWASWCESCRFEFPFFREATVEFRDRVAFLGLDSADERDAAESFMREFPAGFPSIFDPDASVAQSLGGGRSWPMTFYFDRSGEQVHSRIGAYATPEQLEADIRRFALGEGG